VTPKDKPASPGAGRSARESERLNRILSLAGLTSRRKADLWIQSGRVTVNGRPVTEPGSRALWGEDRIKVDGEPIPPPTERHTLMLNKPFGYISSLYDPAGRPVVTDLLKDVDERVYPVGRLDYDTMGLLLMTNDGRLAHRLTHPAYQIPRTYKVTVSGSVTEARLKRLRRGLPIARGLTVKARVRVLTRGEGRTVLRMVISEGKNRQVRRMLEAVDHRVIHLVRTHFGPLALGRLKVGAYRRLTSEELGALEEATGLNRSNDLD